MSRRKKRGESFLRHLEQDCMSKGYMDEGRRDRTGETSGCIDRGHCLGRGEYCIG